MSENAMTTFSSYDPQAWAQMEKMANTFIKAGSLPSTIDNVPKLMMVFQAARDSGLTATEALNAYYFVNGKLTMWGSIALSQVAKAGFKVEWLESSDTVAKVKLSRSDRGEIIEQYTFEEASKAGLTGKDVWKKYPRNMLKWKAFGNAVRFFCPEALNGFYLKEEMDDVEAVATSQDASAYNALLARIEAVVTKEDLEATKEELKNSKWPSEQYGNLARAWTLKKAEITPTVTVKEEPKEKAPEQTSIIQPEDENS